LSQNIGFFLSRFFEGLAICTVFEKFTAMRYQDADAEELSVWTVIATRIEQRNGIKIPIECEASWELNSGKWTWLKSKITDIKYNVEEIPVANNPS